MDMGQCLFEMGAPGGVKRAMVETWLNHGSSLGNWVADRTMKSQAVPYFFFCLRRHFSFFAPQKGFVG